MPLQYTTPDNYTAVLGDRRRGETDYVSRNVTIAERDEVPKVTGVAPEKKGATLERAPIGNTYTATVKNASLFNFDGVGGVDVFDVATLLGEVPRGRYLAPPAFSRGETRTSTYYTRA